MNDKYKEILLLCSDRPRTARELVMATGGHTSTVKGRIHGLVKKGALKLAGTDGGKAAYLYQAVPGWQNPRPLGSDAYRPLGICVWGVWM